jgi:peptidoglycan/xylan/chitin deacetylase (PgdA/CDA1 family)
MLISPRAIKVAALRALEVTGGMRAFGASGWRRSRLLILAYHGISRYDEHRWNGALYMSPEMLAGRMRMLRESGCTVCSLAEGLERLFNGTLEPRTVVVTFDDGFEDFLACAYPILTELQIPATVFLPTLSLGAPRPSFPLACSYILWKANRAAVRLPDLAAQPFAVADAPSRTAAVVAIMKIMKQEAWSSADRDRFVRALAEGVSVNYDDILERRLFRVMSAEDVARLSAAGIDFQLHTHTHNTPREREAFAREIEVNRERIEQLTHVRPSHFCYPSGNYDPAFLTWLQELGVASAVTCDPGLATRDTPALMLPRFVDTSTTSDVEFRGWLAGPAALLSRRRSYADPPDRPKRSGGMSVPPISTAPAIPASGIGASATRS